VCGKRGNFNFIKAMRPTQSSGGLICQKDFIACDTQGLVDKTVCVPRIPGKSKCPITDIKLMQDPTPKDLEGYSVASRKSVK